MIGNLIAPFLYTVVEVALEGMEFFEEPRHIAFWGYALVIGMLQEIRSNAEGIFRSLLILVESVLRTSILLVGYWVFETASDGTNPTLVEFLSEDSHMFVALATLFIGAVLGIANLNAQSYLDGLRRAAGRLRLYSEWLLGRTLLSKVMSDPDALSLRRQQRAVVFADIRGFTGWSDMQPPERVVSLLNQYFETGEKVWARYPVIKTKHNADEILLVFSDPGSAVKAALDLRQESRKLLGSFGLSAGIGIHYGDVVEGLIGSGEIKGYDVIGDVVNTAKRICDQAAGGEILISHEIFQALDPGVQVGEPRELSVRGKDFPLTVYGLVGLDSQKSSRMNA